jgi:hypothetical protein
MIKHGAAFEYHWMIGAYKCWIMKHFLFCAPDDAYVQSVLRDVSYDFESRSTYDYPLEVSVEHVRAAQNWGPNDALAEARQVFSFWFVFFVLYPRSKPPYSLRYKYVLYLYIRTHGKMTFFESFYLTSWSGITCFCRKGRSITDFIKDSSRPVIFVSSSCSQF